MPVNSEIFRIYRHLFYGSPLMILGMLPFRFQIFRKIYID